jgi:cobalamin biosynthesis Mg chelatase CobN
VLKAKKAKYVAQEENDFEEAADDDLFAPVTKSTTQTPSGQNQTASSSAKSSSKSPQTIFEDHLTFITDRLGPNPTNKALQVRSNALRQLLHYTSSKSQIERAVEVVPLWRESGRKVDEPTTAEFIGELIALKCFALSR